MIEYKFVYLIMVDKCNVCKPNKYINQVNNFDQ